MQVRRLLVYCVESPINDYFQFGQEQSTLDEFFSIKFPLDKEDTTNHCESRLIWYLPVGTVTNLTSVVLLLFILLKTQLQKS